MGEEAVQQPQPLIATAALAVGAAILVQPQGAGGGDGPGLNPLNRAQALRQAQNWPCHEGISPSLPAIAPGQAADHARLRQLDPVDARIPRPSRHTPVAPVGPKIAGLLMADNAGDPVAQAKPRQNLNRVAGAQRQRQAKGGTVRAQHLKAFGDKAPVPGCGIAFSPKLRLHDIGGQHGAKSRRIGQRRVIVQAQIAFEPDENIHGTFM